VIILSNISKIDKNFVVDTSIEKEDICFFDITEKPFALYGVFKQSGKYRRMPEDIAKKVSEGVYSLHTNTTGGRVRFSTDSSYVAIKAQMDGMTHSSTFAFTGSTAFDIYIDNVYYRTFIPPVDMEDGYESVVEFCDTTLREITINFPLYSNVINLFVGIKKNSLLKEPEPYAISEPVVFYGSSITQGGCASRPGMSYEAILSRNFDFNYINLGFSGGAKGELEMADYIKGLRMSAFVYDYDHNAPDVEHLKKTHEKMFKIIREAHQEMPIIIMSAPTWHPDDGWMKRREVVEKTYKNAVASGDKNVYFINGDKLMELCKKDGTVDLYHPTDFGFFSIASALSDVFAKIL